MTVAVFPAILPAGAATCFGGIVRVMDIILHAGAHRTGTTSFQSYLRGNTACLAADGTGYWGPRRLRKGLFSGLFPGSGTARGRNLQRRAEGRVQMHLALAEKAGVARMLVTDENMMGSPRACLSAGMLYPAVGERMARVSAAFGGRVDRVVITLRALDLWWASVAAYTVARGQNMPELRKFDQIACSARGWRDVITDLACALPNAQIIAIPFEHIAGRPDTLLGVATGRAAPTAQRANWLNRSPDLRDLRTLLSERGGPVQSLPEGDGRWQPFTPAQSAALRETYADDMMWLHAGADGLATLTEDPFRKRAGTSLPAEAMTRGHDDDQRRQDNVAQSG